jgi:hypothetical protein
MYTAWIRHICGIKFIPSRMNYQAVPLVQVGAMGRFLLSFQTRLATPCTTVPSQHKLPVGAAFNRAGGPPVLLAPPALEALPRGPSLDSFSTTSAAPAGTTRITRVPSSVMRRLPRGDPQRLQWRDIGCSIRTSRGARPLLAGQSGTAEPAQLYGIIGAACRPLDQCLPVRESECNGRMLRPAVTELLLGWVCRMQDRTAGSTPIAQLRRPWQAWHGASL